MTWMHVIALGLTTMLAVALGDLAFTGGKYCARFVEQLGLAARRLQRLARERRVTPVRSMRASTRTSPAPRATDRPHAS